MYGALRKILTIIGISLSCSAQAQIGSSPLTFAAWKEAQVNDATTQMFKISARISQLRANRGATPGLKDTSQAHLPSTRVKTADGDPVLLAEKDLRRAKESLETANNLELGDYVNIYLPTLDGQPEALSDLVEKTPKDDLGEILKLLLAKNRRDDTKRNSSVISGLSPRN